VAEPLWSTSLDALRALSRRMFLLQDERRYADPDYEPLLLVRWIVRRPLIVASASIAIAILLTVGTV
jgi:uncharacterized membrane protein YdfJ with MMPL/SSD domain